MNRFEEIREIVDDLLLRQQDQESRRCGYVHLYGVSAVCRLLALKRGLDLEIARIAGLFHDIYVYTTGLTVCHAVNSAEQVRVILRDLLCSLPMNRELSVLLSVTTVIKS